MTVDAAAVGELVRRCLPYRPNQQQDAVIDALGRFVAGGDGGRAEPVFVLAGYAGTGKTSLTGALVRALAALRVATVLLAPTGRAAKVFSAYAGKRAYTIHRRIYRHSPDGGMELTVNGAADTIYIVDEASMIAGADERGHNILEDLVQYVYTGRDCRLLLLGDTAQLPPVGAEFSPAMDRDTLRSLGLRVTRAVLTAIARQQQGSGILANATMLRQLMRQDPLPVPRLITSGHDDVKAVSTEDLPEMISQAYSRDGVAETTLITRSNMRACGFNRAIRSEVLYLEEELSRGELMIVAKNNYFWSRGNKDLDFVANGDTVTVERIIATEMRYGFRFADVELSMPDREVRFQAKIMLETLVTESAGLPRERHEALYRGVMTDPEAWDPATPMETRARRLRDNPYWNALQVKYAYAVTCHKAQGGQWTNVFIDMSYIPPEAMGMDFYRWLYTAVTRATGCVYFINAPADD